MENAAEAQLLLEADRFCCLPEAATVLAFASNRRFWAEGPDKGNNFGGVAPSLMDFHATDVMRAAEIKDHILSQCEDDAHLYLRIWDGWENTPVGDRSRWASEMGFSGAALQQVDGKRRRLLGPFLDPEKGDVLRRVSARRLDVLRLAATRAFPETLYRLDGAEGVLPLGPESEGSELEPAGYEFHPGSVGSKLGNLAGAFTALRTRRVPAYSHDKYRAVAKRGHVLELESIIRFDVNKWVLGKTGVVNLAVQAQSFVASRSPESLPGDAGITPLSRPDLMSPPTAEQRRTYLSYQVYSQLQ